MEHKLKSAILLIDPRDNVGVALDDLTAGQQVAISGGTVIEVQEKIAQGHKIALKNIQNGEWVIKYGERIGKATSNIIAGHHVHVHNVKDVTEELVRERQAEKC